MFTGIVEEIGEVIELSLQDGILQYTILSPWLETTLGGSIAVDGVCQTLVSNTEGRLTFDAIPETLEKTTLKFLKKGDHVNLERPARLGDEIGGHLLSGHILGTADIVSIQDNVFQFSFEPSFMRYLFPKGYIALDGISLTLVDVDLNNSVFSVHLIPETLSRTTLSFKMVGDTCNVEVDTQTQAIVETIERIHRRSSL